MKNSEKNIVSLVDFIGHMYGHYHGAKVDFANKFGLSKQKLNSLIKEDCVVFDEKILRPVDPEKVIVIDGVAYKTVASQLA